MVEGEVVEGETGEAASQAAGEAAGEAEMVEGEMVEGEVVEGEVVEMVEEEMVEGEMVEMVEEEMEEEMEGAGHGLSFTSLLIALAEDASQARSWWLGGLGCGQAHGGRGGGTAAPPPPYLVLSTGDHVQAPLNAPLPLALSPLATLATLVAFPHSLARSTGAARRHERKGWWATQQCEELRGRRRTAEGAGGGQGQGACVRRIGSAGADGARVGHAGVAPRPGRGGEGAQGRGGGAGARGAAWLGLRAAGR